MRYFLLITDKLGTLPAMGEGRKRAASVNIKQFTFLKHQGGNVTVEQDDITVELSVALCFMCQTGINPKAPRRAMCTVISHYKGSIFAKLKKANNRVSYVRVYSLHVVY